MKGLARRPSPSAVIALLALVVALGGTAIAGGVLNKKKVNKIISRRAPGLSVADSAKLGGQPPGAYASASSEPWHEVGTPGEPGYQNGWAHGGLATDSTAAFYKDPLGLVHLKGLLFRAGGGGVTAFTLPPGYRPGQGLSMPASAGSLTIETDGSVKPSCGSPCTTGIDGLSFRP